MNKILHLAWLLLITSTALGQIIPLPEHPRPDFERPDWLNLNGAWEFEFDSSNQGVSEKWFQTEKKYSKKIMVPFPWGSALSGVKDEADIAWYRKTFTVPKGWDLKKKIFLTIGASDWETTVWLNGRLIGQHQGGYMPFSFELNITAIPNAPHTLTIKVDDKRRPFTLYGKQGYGNARGIWQTAYLESRGHQAIDAIRCIPDIDKNKVIVQVDVDANQPNQTVQVTILTPNGPISKKTSSIAYKSEVELEFDLPNAKRWTLSDPYLYTLTVETLDDKVMSYFGMRKISVMKLPNTEIPYIALNNQPIYLQLALDQSYHPEGFYTFPSDTFIREEIQRSKSIGLNGIRTHIKPDIPRKLYWADKLGLLIMADLPNSWGEPDAMMQNESETTLREMIKRDFNHPSIFSWIVFNETWGLTSKITKDGKTTSEYLPKTQQWVASMYYLTKSLDPTRLVEDNSICCGRGHTETDIYSWHEYLPGWAWEDHMATIVKNNYSGSPYHFEKGFFQAGQPNINSECGNVWGYEGSTGDVDWSYDYHRMMNTFRKYPQMAGWLYTEHHDVINEWNGYWRFDRSQKHTGVESIVNGMSLNDFHSNVYVSTGNDITKTVQASSEVSIPVYLSIYDPGMKYKRIDIRHELWLTNQTGTTKRIAIDSKSYEVNAWMQKPLDPIKINVPEHDGLALLKIYAISEQGDTLHRNFMHLVIESGTPLPNTTIIKVKPDAFVKQSWTQKQWSVLNGLKVNGAGTGYFEYHIPLDQSLKKMQSKTSYIIMELSAKQLWDKDRGEVFNANQDYMLGSKVSPSKNPNSYPMTDETKSPSQLTISVNGTKVMTKTLEDDPADHRGILSWHHQLKDKKLREAGSYGYLVRVPIDKRTLQNSFKQGYLALKLESKDGGGLAVYGSKFGSYPIDINLVLLK